MIFIDQGLYNAGWRYMEAAPTDQGSFPWGPVVSTTVYWTDVGKGVTNTAYLVAGVNYWAAVACDNLVIGAYSDWFLPSKDELNLMLINLAKRDLGVPWSMAAWYWTSSEFGISSAYVQMPSTLQSTDGLKSSYYQVRAARMF